MRNNVNQYNCIDNLLFVSGFEFNLPLEEIREKVNYTIDKGRYIPMLMPFEDEEDGEFFPCEIPPGGFFRIISEQ